ncbi:conserved hypothetical protein [Roseibium sp. TrichSKD4]|uniref:hypothetical protein n=1 Tax=Roseibium sp. TrichSKD4 TaxID=744980 RepID=UPI0001E57620|nr:hypothetical protein [Roseibium sp. TrichSKD4]EFO30967.1 conserved hypothetical protein [Roseibium sp. TrichSKD4]
MAGRRKTLRDLYTIDMFSDWTPPRVSVGYETGAIPGNRVGSRISRALGLALKDCGKGRAEIAHLMSERLDQKVTLAMLDAYAAEGKTGNNITVERFHALIHATGQLRLLGFLAEDFDMKVIPARFESVIELALLEDHEVELETRKKLLRAKIGGTR